MRTQDQNANRILTEGCAHQISGCSWELDQRPCMGYSAREFPMCPEVLCEAGFIVVAKLTK